MEANLIVNGAVASPLSLSLADLHDYPAHSVATTYANNDRVAAATYTGARLWDVLLTAQVTSDPAMDKKLRVMARAKDRFRCLLRWHEFDPAQTDRLVLIAYEKDGQPLDSASGPLRLVVPGDAQGVRYLRGLALITVLTGQVEEEAEDE